MKKIALMCDSAADIAKEEAERLHIHVLRMPLIINGKEYMSMPGGLLQASNMTARRRAKSGIYFFVKKT